jgi:hypothetical protein
VRKDIEQH